MGLPRLETPLGCWLVLSGFFQALKQCAAHPFVKLTASDANIPFLILFFLFPLILDLDHLRAHRVILPLEVILKHLIAPLPLLLLLFLPIHPLLLFFALLVHCVPEIAGGPEKEWFFVGEVGVVGKGEGKCDDAEYILGLEHDRVIVINWKIYSFLLYRKMRYLASQGSIHPVYVVVVAFGGFDKDHPRNTQRIISDVRILLSMIIVGWYW